MPVRLDGYPLDRRTIARMSLATFQVRCLGTLAGTAGLLLGVWLGALIASAVSAGPVVTVLWMLLGAVGGFFAAVWLALSWMAQ